MFSAAKLAPEILSIAFRVRVRVSIAFICPKHLHHGSEHVKFQPPHTQVSVSEKKPENYIIQLFLAVLFSFFFRLNCLRHTFIMSLRRSTMEIQMKRYIGEVSTVLHSRVIYSSKHH